MVFYATFSNWRKPEKTTDMSQVTEDFFFDINFYVPATKDFSRKKYLGGGQNSINNLGTTTGIMSPPTF